MRHCLTRGLTAAAVAAVATGAASTAGAQAPVAAPAGARYGGGTAFAIEALAGSVGSLAGMAVVGLGSDCDSDDLGCIINTIGAGGIAGMVGATVAVTLAARHTGSPRSVAGAALGAVVGTGVGLGVHYLVNKGTDRNLGEAVVIPIFAVSQGVVAAAGSRLLGRR